MKASLTSKVRHTLAESDDPAVHPLEAMASSLKSDIERLFPAAGKTDCYFGSNLGPTVTIRVVIDPKDTWSSGIWQNAKQQMTIIVHGGNGSQCQVKLLSARGMPKLIARTGEVQAVTDYISRYLSKAAAAISQ